MTDGATFFVVVAEIRLALSLDQGCTGRFLLKGHT